MAEWLLQQLISLGVKAEKRGIGQHKLEGKDVDLPPVIIGQLVRGV
jgi:Cys-Gly metallodipeptidase DUG1